MCVNVFVWAWVGECRCLWRPEEDVSPPEAGVTDGCKLPDIDAGNQT